MKNMIGIILHFLFAASAVTGFSRTSVAAVNSCSWSKLCAERGDGTSSESRREVLSKAAASSMAAFLPLVSNADSGAEVRGIELTPFNGLIFQYRGGEFGGLKASDIDEPSMSYADFVAKLKGGEVDFVEFLAPDGDAAYATIKGDSKPIRIGEGYPIEQHDGYSSPAFAVRAVKNAGVPYKFTVPALRTMSVASSK